MVGGPKQKPAYMRRLIVIVAFLALAACKGDKDDSDDGLALEKTLKATVDGQVITSTTAEAEISTSVAELLQISAAFGSRDLVIAIYSDNSNEPIVAGEYKFDGSDTHVPVANCFYSLNNGTSPYGTIYVNQTDVGKVTITELDRSGKTVSGTFEATVGRNNEVLKIEKGSFTKIPLTNN